MDPWYLGTSRSLKPFSERLETSAFPPVHPDLDRLLAFVCRELGAREARLVEAGAELTPGPDPRELRAARPDGRSVAVLFDDPPSDREAKLRRLEMLVGTFSGPLEDPASPSNERPPAAVALQAELADMTKRSAALNAVVIDANSPIIWGAAAPEGVAVDGSSTTPDEPSMTPSSTAAAASRFAIQTLREDRTISSSRKGRPARYIERAGEVPFVAHSFAGIYWLLLIFDGPFDELRAERVILESLPRVERLVMALPPVDPSPRAGARVVRKRR